MEVTKSSNLFITGCDSHRQWQLPWFVENFKKFENDVDSEIIKSGPIL